LDRGDAWELDEWGREPLATVPYVDKKYETLVIRFLHSPLGTQQPMF